MAQEKIAACRSSNEVNKSIQIDFFYLDLNSCERCVSTSVGLDAAVSELRGILDTLGFMLSVNKVEISSPELAERYRFASSPTIRVNGRDICADLRENACKDCGDLCGSDVECRVFEYEGTEYNAPPKAMIVDAVLKAIYQPSACDCDAYTMPENLKTFFVGKSTPCCEGKGSCCQ